MSRPYWDSDQEDFVVIGPDGKRRLQQLWDKLRHHERMVRIHDGLVSRHRLEVERCEALLGIDDQEGAA